MSVHYTIRCGFDEVDGPQIRYGHTGPRLYPAVGSETDPHDLAGATAEWARFLDEHEWCGELRLVHG